MRFVDKIFREYDIRGVYDTDYTSGFAELLGNALATYIKQSHKPIEGGRYRFGVGRDARPSGVELSTRFRNALVEHGFDVYDLGIVPTPVVYFSTHHMNLDGAVSITGSHNPSENNGFKNCIGKSTLHGHQIQELKKLCQIISKNPEEAGPKSKTGSIMKYDIVSPYLSDIKSRIKLDRKLKVVLDAGNGTAAEVAPKVIAALGCDVIPLFCELDGTFPNHHPDPTVPENLEDLQAAVLKHKADLGIAYDGDADRIGAVDEKARAIYGDELMVLYSREILSRKPGAKILSEVKCSTRLYQDIEKHGGKGIMWKTGHSLIKAKMKEEGCELGGEMSGHMFFADRYYGYDDAIYASARLLEIVAKTNAPMSTLLADLPSSVNTPELRVDCADEIKFKVIEKVKQDLGAKFKIIDIDGVRIETNDGWGLIRASNTQPVVVMRFEASNDARLNELKKIVETAFESAKKTLGVN